MDAETPQPQQAPRGYNEVFRVEGHGLDGGSRRNRVAIGRWNADQADTFEVFSAYSGEGVMFQIDDLDEAIDLLRQAKAAVRGMALTGVDAAQVRRMPRDWFLHGADVQREPALGFEKSRRRGLVDRATSDIERLLVTVRNTRHFDAMGNIELIMPQALDVLADVNMRVRNLQEEIAEARDHYLNRGEPSKENSSPAAAPAAGEVPQPGTAASPLAAVPGTPNKAVPKPGPDLLGRALKDAVSHTKGKDAAAITRRSSR
ncbi:hypothetical protein V1638_04110 [Pseudarthrobacter sp. J64]|uniref:hypothetical protein n=1 Tax=Pseudarthrobacter sp. J64 TaxID=3116485 RepID=UPI002E7FD888|nr:hypothetical protein [Pseudarthrobacter sp. J64]MEE2568581.1 hypothetical protein [Pseudarthrobacter sp. J64]